jgi:hypothetical protein
MNRGSFDFGRRGVGGGNGSIIGHRDAPSDEELRLVWASRGIPVGTKSVRVVLEAASMVVFNNSHQRERVDHARTVMLASVLSPPRASASDIGTIPALVDDRSELASDDASSSVR